MAVAHAFGFARDLNLNCPTETSTFVHHQSPRVSVPLSCLLAHRGSTSRTSPSVMPQLARVAAGMCPTISTICSDAFVAFVSASNKRSVLPGAWYPTKDVDGDRHMADGRERQVSGHQRLAVRGQLPQKTHPDAGRLLGVVFEAVVPVGVLEPDLEHGVAGERQPVAAGREADHTVPGC